MKKLYAGLFFISLLAFVNNAYSQKHPTNNTKSYDSTSAVTEINTLHGRVLKGEDIGVLATQYTQDPGSFQKNGILNKLKLEVLDEAFAYYIKKLKIGEVSKPFETPFGWHIAKLLAIDAENKYLVQHILIMRLFKLLFFY